MKAGRPLRVMLAAALAALGTVVAAPTPAQSTPTMLGSFSTGLEPIGIGVDPATGNLYVYPAFSPDIIEYTPSGTEVSPRIPRPGANSNDFDLDFALETVTIAGVTVPAGSLLAVNGEVSPEVIFGLNKDDGSVLASRDLTVGSEMVGVAHHPGRDTIFLLHYGAAEIVEINPNDATELNRFPAAPSGSPGFGTFFGDIDINEATGNLFVVSDTQNVIRELTSTGRFVRDYDVGSLGISGMAGIAIDADGNAWIATRSGVVYHVGGIFEDAPPPECTSDPNAVCSGPDNDDVEGTSGDDFIFTGGGDDTVDGGAGADDIFGASGNDRLAGGGDDDHLAGGTGKDVLVGDVDTVGRMAEDVAGDDTLSGGGGPDEILGQAGDDILNGDGGDDVLKAGGGTNILRGGPGIDKCVVTSKDTTKSCETIKKKRRNF